MILIFILLLFGWSLAQLEWVWFIVDVSNSSNVLAVPLDWSLIEDRQTTTRVDSGGFVASWLDFLGNDNVSLSGEIDIFVESETFTGDTSSWILLSWINLVILDPIPHLIVSEVYYDGTDERIEITNIGQGNFQGDIILSWVKSTPVSLTNISILSGESKIYGDTLVQLSWNSFVGKTGLAFSMTDTSAIHIYLIISGQREDSFIVDQYRVKKYNDKKNSFEKVGEVPTWVQSDRIANAQSGYTINPGIYFSTGSSTNDVSVAPEQSWVNLQPPLSCDLVDQRDLIKINEIFFWNEKYPPYIEVAVHDTIGIDILSISGNLLSTGIDFLFDSWGITLGNNTLLLVTATGFWKTEGIDSVRNSDFSLLSTWNWLLITIGSWQNRRVMDIVYLSGVMLGSSSYFWSTRQECVRIMDGLDDFSPGFEQRFLKYFPVTTVTKIEYVSAGIENQPEIVSCPLSWQDSSLTWKIEVVTDVSSIGDEYVIDILSVDYDPEGSDTNNEKITLFATHISGKQLPLDLSKIFRLKVNGTNKTLPRILPMNTPTTFTKTFGFPNSTVSGQDVIIQFTYGDYVFATYTYNPKKLSSQDMLALTTTWYTVSSVLDGDTFRIKYQGKTQSVRLLGIDAPESTKTRYKYLECFGVEAKNYLKSLIDKKKITFQFDPSQDQKDIYDRLLAYVFLDDENINQTMIEDGYAKEYTYKTPYFYQSQFKQAEQSAQQQWAGLWSESTCGVSLSGIQLTGDSESTGNVFDLSGLQFTITYVLPNPKWSDTAEELWLLIKYGTRDEEIGRSWQEIVEWGEMDSRFRENEVESNENVPRVLVTQLDLSQEFSLRIGTTKKKIEGIVSIGQENILSGSLGLVNKAACVSLFYQEQELTKFCYGKPTEGQKIYSSSEWLAETSKENLDILNLLQLKRIGNNLCVWYKEQSFLCKRIPASKAEIKATQEQKLYKWFASLIKQYIINNWKSLYYDTQLKQYFDLVAQNKKLIADGISNINIYGQLVSITDLKEQLSIIEKTLPGIAALFIGKKMLRE